MSMQLSLEYRLESLCFNNLDDEMLLDREHQYTEKGIWHTRRSACYLDAAAKLIQWFEQNELEGDDFDEVDVIEDPNYVPAI